MSDASEQRRPDSPWWVEPASLVAALGVPGLLAWFVVGAVWNPLQAESAGAAGAVCLAAGLLGWLGRVLVRRVLYSRAPDSPTLPLAAMAAGMGPRLFGPLGLALYLKSIASPLAAAGFVYWLLPFYAAGLALETAWLLPGVKLSSRPLRKAVLDA